MTDKTEGIKIEGAEAAEEEKMAAAAEDDAKAGQSPEEDLTAQEPEETESPETEDIETERQEDGAEDPDKKEETEAAEAAAPAGDEETASGKGIEGGDVTVHITKDTDGTGIIDQFGTVNYSWIDAFDANGVRLFDEKGRSCDFTVREIGDAIAFLEKLNALNSERSLYERNFAQGNVVFQPMLFSEYRAYKSQELSFKKYSGFEWECVTMPSGPSGDNYSRLDTLSIAMSEKTTQEDTAWEFMKLLTSDPQIQSEIFDYSAGISVLPQVTQSSETQNRLKESTGSVFNLAILESAMRKSVFRTRFRGDDNAMEEVGLAVRSILDSNSNIQMEQIIWNRTINNYMKTLQQNE